MQADGCGPPGHGSEGRLKISGHRVRRRRHRLCASNRVGGPAYAPSPESRRWTKVPKSDIITEQRELLPSYTTGNVSITQLLILL